MAADVRSVIDGDTLLLDDGRFVRLIGIDAPEKARKNRQADELALEAKRKLEALVQSSDGWVRLEEGVVARDQYGRTLAHVYSLTGHYLNAAMLEAGLATLMPFPPNTRHISEWTQAQDSARQNRRGLWGKGLFSPKRSDRLKGALNKVRWVEGQIRSVNITRHATFVTLAGGLVLKSSNEEWQTVLQARPIWRPGLWVSVVGKTYRVKNEVRMRLRHPAQLIKSDKD